MPQIWVTYQELATYMGADIATARDHAMQCELPRRRCSDDLTRVKLDMDTGIDLMAGLAAMQQAVKLRTGMARPAALPLRDIDEDAMRAAVAAGGADYVAGEFSDLLVQRLRSVAEIGRGRVAVAS